VTALLFGAGVGLGAWICLLALAPRPEPIAALLARLDQPGRALTATAPVKRRAIAEQAESAVGRALDHAGMVRAAGPALELVSRTAQRQAVLKVTCGLAGAFGALLVGAGLSLGGVSPPAITFVLVVAAAAAGFLLPDLLLRDQAARRRRAFRHALSAYLDLVNILLAGGAGIETALYAAADAGDGWAFVRLRLALSRARRTGRSPWDCLADLGTSVGVGELGELAASVALAGSHGARIRASLAAKADALRGHQVAETEAAAEAATERMTIPLAVLLFGFLVLIGYPAIRQITTVVT
jgi:tight adherence protein C